MTLIYLATGNDYGSFHRRPFIRTMAEQMAQQQRQVFYCAKPRWFIKAGATKGDIALARSEQVIVINLFTLMPLSWCMKWPWLLWLMVTMPIAWQLRRATREQANNGQRMLWFYKPDQYLYLAGLGDPYVYMHYDNYDDDDSYSFAQSPKYAATLKACLQQAQFGFTTSQTLQRKLAQFRHLDYLPNAIDTSMLQQAQVAKPTDRGEVRIIGFVGSIDNAIDPELIEALCQHPQPWHIRLVGPVSNDDITKLAEHYDNLTLVGRVAYDDLAAQITQFDVGICPYKASPFNQYRNPLKLYEYLAFGLPAVSVDCDFDELGWRWVAKAQSVNQFVSLVAQQIALNSPELALQRHQFAAENTWRARALEVTRKFDQRQSSLQATRVSFLGLDFDDLDSSQVLQQLKQWADSARDGHIVVTPNVDHVVKYHDRELTDFKRAYDAAAMVLCDSQILRRLSSFGRQSLSYLNTGSDLTVRLFEQVLQGSDYRVMVIGSSATDVAQVMTKYRVANCHCHVPPMGFIDDPIAVQACVEQVQHYQPDFIFLAVGCPRQEILAQHLKTQGCHGVMLCIGASIDFMVGKQHRAPMWMQKNGLEWLFRLCSSPQRLWRRYLVDGPKILRIYWSR
ncbi:hypothetical protein GCM10011369_02360 [Neiella marina]|uniref:WecB/TagA/CpsF family glycosyltransferase n=1 Tax=Neiella marina TaxID=508461 RepID=A0A8J2U1W3_9GAMM|nr:WecB/TagA/CpsF family glycosyltransferase [Neiella marina]GGA64524.1 hypothetical protein GCM10011369_02360 [Neiella marina]